MTFVIVLDFDGVLAVPWSNPEALFPQIPTLLGKLRQQHHLALASFNPRAIRVLRENQQLPHFHACRAGAHHEGEIVEFSVHLGPLCKAEQIRSLQRTHFPDVPMEHFYFFDDTPEHLVNVGQQLPSVNCRLIDPDRGLQEQDVADLM